MNERNRTKTSTFKFQRAKIFGLKAFEFREQFMIDTFLRILTHFEKKKTGSIGEIFISLQNLKHI